MVRPADSPQGRCFAPSLTGPRAWPRPTQVPSEGEEHLPVDELRNYKQCLSRSRVVRSATASTFAPSSPAGVFTGQTVRVGLPVSMRLDDFAVPRLRQVCGSPQRLPTAQDLGAARHL